LSSQSILRDWSVAREGRSAEDTQVHVDDHMPLHAKAPRDSLGRVDLYGMPLPVCEADRQHHMISPRDG
jgi:hypothetical protein